MSLRSVFFFKGGVKSKKKKSLLSTFENQYHRDTLIRLFGF